MRFSAQAFAFSCLVASAACAETDGKESVLRKRQLQTGFEDVFPGQDNTGTEGSPLDDLLGGLSTGFEDMINLTAIQAMDPLELSGVETITFNGEDGTLINDILNCTGNVTVTLQPAILTGLSTLTMDRFELVQDTAQTQDNWWSGLMTWSGTFDMLATADYLILETGIMIAPQEDTTCLPQDLAEEDGSFYTGISISLIKPVLEMFFEIGGNTPTGLFATMFGDSESVADSISTDQVIFTYDSWTVTFDNPNVNQTLNITEIIEMADAFLQDTFNITDFNIGGLEGFEGLDGLDGVTSFIQNQTNTVARSAGFTF